jgi:hypothetical protein
MAVAERPVGKVSATLALLVVAPVPEFETLIVYEPVCPASNDEGVLVMLIVHAGDARFVLLPPPPQQHKNAALQKTSSKAGVIYSRIMQRLSKRSFLDKNLSLAEARGRCGIEGRSVR